MAAERRERRQLYSFPWYARTYVYNDGNERVQSPKSVFISPRTRGARHGFAPLGRRPRIDCKCQIGDARAALPPSTYDGYGRINSARSKFRNFEPAAIYRDDKFSSGNTRGRSRPRDFARSAGRVVNSGYLNVPGPLPCVHTYGIAPEIVRFALPWKIYPRRDDIYTRGATTSSRTLVRALWKSSYRTINYVFFYGRYAHVRAIRIARLPLSLSRQQKKETLRWRPPLFPRWPLRQRHTKSSVFYKSA